MNTYQYKVRDRSGKPINGVMAGDSADSVAEKLKNMDYTPIAIEEVKGGSFLKNIVSENQSIRFSDLNMLTRQLYTLEKSGIPLLNSLYAIGEQVTHASLKNIVKQLARDIEAGQTLSSALERYPRVFDNLYVNMIRSGELSGRLAEILERLAILGEHEEKIRMRIKTATRYPMMVVGAIVIGFFILVTLVIPRFVDLYSKFDAELPFFTRLLIFVHQFVTHYWWLLLAVLAGGIFAAGKIFSSKEGLYYFDRFKLKVPVFGPLLLKITMSRFCRVTSILLQSGIPILQILDLASQGVGNVVVAQAITDIKNNINEGKSMLEPMKKSGLFPPIVIQMISLGEESGRLDELLLHVADYYDSQIDYTLENLISLIEPLLIMVLGVVVLVMALGIFMPMWNLINVFKR